tara:strand:+ start:136 stop:330 length:195 start_codon:yes stop_codon:yes gene_type:complete
MSIYKVKLTYRYFDVVDFYVFDVVEVEADNEKDALKKATELLDDADYESLEDSKILEVKKGEKS